MTKYLILVEGIADIIFLRDYLIFLDFNLKQIIQKKENKKDCEDRDKELILESNEKIIHIRAMGGYTKIKKEKTTIQEYYDANFKVLIIQDADDPSKENGGIVNRMTYLTQQKEALSIQFETFLFPNHLNDGDLETLLLQIKKEEKYNPSQECYQAYIECTKKIDSQCSAELQEDKSLVFNYFRTYYGMKNSKEENRKYESDYWDFESEALYALKGFLENFLFIG